MSEPTPSSIPTSRDPRSHRPLKKQRQLPPSATATATAASAISHLMSDPSHPLHLPSSSTPKTHDSLAAPPEIVTNVQGSSAGAGSGEFHVYKASRRREYERIRLMDEEAKREEEDERWGREERERRERDEEATRRKRERRARRKGGKGKGKGKKELSEDVDGDETQNGAGDNGNKAKTKLPPKLRDLNGSSAGKDKERENGDAHDTSSAGIGVAAVIEENGITIHDDDD